MDVTRHICLKNRGRGVWRNFFTQNFLFLGLASLFFYHTFYYLYLLISIVLLLPLDININHSRAKVVRSLVVSVFYEFFFWNR